MGSRRDVTRCMAVVPDWGSCHAGASHDARGDTVIRRGDDDITFTCGSCGAPILIGVAQSLVRHFLFRCRGCGAPLRVVD